ncbi:MAG: hypothetical protein ABWY12_07620 [Burkholderiales bacterium]
MSMTFHPTQPRLDVEQGAREPAMTLVGALPAIHLRTALLTTFSRLCHWQRCTTA